MKISFLFKNTVEGEDLDYNNEKISKANNKEIYSTSVDFQRQKTDNVNKLKELGKKGDEIIQDLINTNETLNKRTLLSQEKILKRLEQRHKYQVYLTKPTLFNLMEMFYLDPYQSRVLLSMRVDTVSTILQNLKFLNHSKSIVFEETNGFITAAIAGRSSGAIVSLFETKPCQKFLAYFNYSNEKKSLVSYFNFKSVLGGNTLQENSTNKEQDNEEINNKSGDSKNNSLNLKEEEGEAEKQGKTEESTTKEVKTRYLFGEKKSKVKGTITVENKEKNMLSLGISKFVCSFFLESFTNLVICCKEENRLLELTIILLPYLKSSGCIVIYGRDKEVSTLMILFFSSSII